MVARKPCFSYDFCVDSCGDGISTFSLPFQPCGRIWWSLCGVEVAQLHLVLACYGHLDVGRRSTSSSSSFYPNSYESMSTTSSCISNISGCLASFLIRKGRYCDPSQHKQETSCSIVRDNSQNSLIASWSRYQEYCMRLGNVDFRTLQRRCIQWLRSRGTGKFSSWSRA